MLQELLTLLPVYAGAMVMWICIAGVVAGMGLWLAGARFSRQLVSLILTGVGTGVGLQVPRWMSWNINGAGSAVALAVILGVLGFLMHRFWIGLFLGAVMSCWTALGSWALLNKDQPFAWPAVKSDTNIASFCMELWQSLPADVTRIMPFAAGIALVSAICIALMWPRIASTLNWSFLGVSMIVVMGIEAMLMERPQWMSMMPAQTWAQLTTFFGSIAFGAIVQWKLSPRKSGKRKSPDKPAEAGTKAT